MIKHDIRMVEIDKIKPYARNARLHSTEQIKQIMGSIKEFGFTNPLIIDSDYNLIAGHGRLIAIKQLNKVDFAKMPILELPCVICEGLSVAQIKALVIADNKIALNAGWDLDLLANELRELDNIGFDLDLTGFGKDEISELLISPDDFGENFTISNNERSEFRNYALCFSVENLQIVEQFINSHKDSELAKGDNFNVKSNIIFNLIKGAI